VEFFEVVERRCSVRDYEDKGVNDELIKIILNAGIKAPSAGNIQPWRFIIVKNQEIKNKLAKAAYGQSFIREAPVNIVVCADEFASSSRYGERGRTLYCIQDTAAAIENILLAVTALNLGACWVGAFKENEVRYILDLPSNIRPVAIIPIGYPKKTAYRTSRYPLQKVTYLDIYGNPLSW